MENNILDKQKVLALLDKEIRTRKDNLKWCKDNHETENGFFIENNGELLLLLRLKQELKRPRKYMATKNNE